MQNFTPLEYIKLAIADAYGLGHSIWANRLKFTNEMLETNTIQECLSLAKEPILMQKAINAYEDAINKIPTGFIMGMDATCSGLQIMACLIGCHKTAEAVNLIDTGYRENAYKRIGDHMGVDAATCKDPVMTHFYGSQKQPELVFGDDVQLFLKTVSTILPGAEEVKNDIQSCQNPNVSEYIWNTPDGHTSYVKTKVAVDKKIEIDELGHATFTHRIYENLPKQFDLSLPANVVHSFDAYVVRQMYRMAESQGFELLTIHDCFWASPNHMQKVRQNYVKILADIANKNYLQDVLRQITQNKELKYIKYSNDLGTKIMQSEYAIC